MQQKQSNIKHIEKKEQKAMSIKMHKLFLKNYQNHKKMGAHRVPLSKNAGWDRLGQSLFPGMEKKSLKRGTVSGTLLLSPLI